MEEYEHFSEEFKKYWKTPRNTEVINQLQKDYDTEVQNVIRYNIERLEECLKTKTKKIITNKEYDIIFDCKYMRGLPVFEPIRQGYDIINKPFVSDEYTNLKYLKKPLTNIGLTPSQFTCNPGKNEFIIIHANSDYDRISNECGYVSIRISNSVIDKHS
jgi:hypothetical protein